MAQTAATAEPGLMNDYLKKLCIIIFAALLLALKLEELARHDETVKRYNTLREASELERERQERKINELEKQIRVLKQDMYIMQHGYENAE